MRETRETSSPQWLEAKRQTLRLSTEMDKSHVLFPKKKMLQAYSHAGAQRGVCVIMQESREVRLAVVIIVVEVVDVMVIMMIVILEGEL